MAGEAAPEFHQVVRLVRDGQAGYAARLQDRPDQAGACGGYRVLQVHYAQLGQGAITAEVLDQLPPAGTHSGN